MKNKIRKQILQKRKNLSEFEWQEKSIIIQKKFLSSKFYKDSKIILSYFHFNREVKTDLIIETALKEKKIICIPKNDWQNFRIIPGMISSLEEINKNSFVPEPLFLREIPKEQIELIIVPGVVFDIYCNRIGMGKGFFDRFLASLPNHTFKVSLAFEFQVLKYKLPVEPWDIKVDFIITEEKEYFQNQLPSKT